MQEGVEYILNLKDLATGKLQKFEAKLVHLDQTFKKTEKSSESFGKIGLGMIAGQYGTRALDTIVGLSGQLVELTGQFDAYQASLGNAISSQRSAAQGMVMIQELAKQTPFEMSNLLKSYVNLANRGVRPLKNELINLGDFASLTPTKTFDDLSEAISDIDNSERWKEFGIKVERAGDKIRLSFRGQTVEAERTATGVMKAITQFGKMEGVAGNMAAVMETLKGRESNLADVQEQLMIGMGHKFEAQLKSWQDIKYATLSYIGDLMDIDQENVRQMKEQRMELFKVRDALVDANKPEKERLELMKKMIREYPQQLGYMKAEAGQMHVMVGALDDIISRTESKIALQKQEDMKTKQQATLISARGELAAFSAAVASSIPNVLKMNPQLKEIYQKQYANRPGVDFFRDVTTKNLGVTGGSPTQYKNNLNTGSGTTTVFELFGVSAMKGLNVIDKTIAQAEANFRALTYEQRQAEQEYKKMFGIGSGDDLLTPDEKKLREGGAASQGPGNIDSSLSASAPKILNITMDAVMKGDIVFQNATDMPMVKATVRKEISNVLAEAVADAKILAPTR
jgi:hypothetical protein